MQLSENSGEKKLSLVVQVSELREWGIEEDQDLGFLKSFLGSVQRKLLPNDPHLILQRKTHERCHLRGRQAIYWVSHFIYLLYR